MHVVHLVETGERAGGVERYLEALLAAETGLTHTVVTHGRGPCTWSGRWPVVHWPWMAPEGGATPPPDLAGDVWLAHTVPADATREAMAGRLAVFAHDHRWWCPSGTRYYAATSQVCTIEAADGACLMRYHAMRCGSLRPGSTRDGFVRARAGRTAMRVLPVTLTASSFMATEARRHGARAATVVPLPVPFDAAPAAREPGPPVILSAARLTPLKGVVQLIHAFAHVRAESRLLIVGDGNGRGEAEAAIATHPRRGAITLAGAMAADLLAAQFAQARVVAVPSLWPEPFGLVGIEALGAGVPVVTSARGGTADWAREDFGVLRANPDDPRAFGAALERALTDGALAERARTAGAAWVRQRHSMAAHVRALRAALAVAGASA